jgi:hypothetical protein
MPIGSCIAAFDHGGVDVARRGRAARDRTAIFVGADLAAIDLLAGDEPGELLGRFRAASPGLPVPLAGLIIFGCVDAKQAYLLAADLQLVSVPGMGDAGDQRGGRGRSGRGDNGE